MFERSELWLLGLSLARTQFLTLALKTSWLHTCLEIQALRKSVVLLRMGVSRPPGFAVSYASSKLSATISVRNDERKTSSR